MENKILVGLCKDCKHYSISGYEWCGLHREALCIMFRMADDKIAKNIGCRQFKEKDENKSNPR